MRHLKLSLFAILVLFGCSKADDSSIESDNALHDLKPLIEVVEYMYSNPPKDDSVTKKIEGIIF